MTFGRLSNMMFFQAVTTPAINNLSITEPARKHSISTLQLCDIRATQCVTGAHPRHSLSVPPRSINRLFSALRFRTSNEAQTRFALVPRASRHRFRHQRDPRSGWRVWFH